MTAPEARTPDPGPPGLDVAALQRFVDREVPGTGRLSAELLHGGRSNLTYLVTDGVSRWVLRRPPLGGLTPSAHDMAREYTVVAALHGSGVPVARPVALHNDADVLGAPFAIVEYVDGMVIRTVDDLHRLPDDEITRCGLGLVDVLARLHAVVPEEVGLGTFGRPQGYLGRQVARWWDQWGRVSTRELPDLERLHARLAADVPTESGAAVVHGDHRIDNAIFDPDDPGVVRALVDWEMATLGDPLADLALHVVYGDPAFAPVIGGAAASASDRLPRADAIVSRYAQSSGGDVANWPFYLALGYFKIAVIAEGIHARHRDGLTVGEGFETVGAAVPVLVSAGLAALA